MTPGEPRPSLCLSLPICDAQRGLESSTPFPMPCLGWEDPLEKEWLPMPAFFPGEFHGERSLGGYSLWGHKELERAEATKHTQDWGQEGNLNHREAEPEGGLRKNPGGFPILATGARSKTGHDLRSPKSLCPILAWEICSLCTLSKTRATSHARGQKSQTSLLTGALFPIKILQSPWN